MDIEETGRGSEELRVPTEMDQIEYDIAQLPEVEMPLTHIFTPGIYVRKIFVPAGTMFTSMEHKTDHPFVMTSGVIDVISKFERIRYEAPYMGITKAGTKRVVYVHEDTIWLTIHANPDDIADPDEIADIILEPVTNPLFPDKNDPRCNVWKTSISPSLICNTINNYQLT